MKLTIVARRAVLILATVAMLNATGARAQLAVQKSLAQIDRTFVCPEDLPSDEARDTALKLFLQQVAAIEPKTTVGDMISYRVSLLKKHQCRQTLANLAQSATPSEEPTSHPASHWEHAGRVVNNGNGVTIAVDMDSMVDAGPGRMRTWIRYTNDKPDANDVKEWMIYEQLDCARSYHSTMSLYSYAEDGHIISSEKGSTADEEPIIPDSILAGILPFTCAAHGLKVR
jgi:hypothetical protein